MRPIGDGATLLYALEEKRQNAIRAAAEEHGRVLGYTSKEYWTRSLPEQLAQVLEANDSRAALVAAVAYLNEEAEMIAMTRQRYLECHRLARVGKLGSLAVGLGGEAFQWFLVEVYDVRHPVIGSDRHAARDRIAKFGRSAGRLWNSLAEWHYKHGWLNCWNKPLIRLWVEFKAHNHEKQ